MDAARRGDSRVSRIDSVILTRLGGVWAHLLGRVDGASIVQRRALVAVGLLAPLLVLYRDLLFAGAPWLDLGPAA